MGHPEGAGHLVGNEDPPERRRPLSPRALMRGTVEIVSRRDVALTIATGEQRIYANLLLTIGVVM